VVNPIVAENLNPGVAPATWDLAGGVSDPAIQGFATAMSVNKGQAISFKVETSASSYRPGQQSVEFEPLQRRSPRQLQPAVPGHAIDQFVLRRRVQHGALAGAQRL
jgi:hypothetical protein